nr:hypothetical protein [Pseudomonas sp. BIGb0427]
MADLQFLGSSQWHNRAVSSIAYLAQFDSTLLVSGDREGQMVLCATPVSEDQCSPVGSPGGRRSAQWPPWRTNCWYRATRSGNGNCNRR